VIMKVLYFGVLSEITGKTEEEIGFNGTVEELRKQMESQYEGFVKQQYQIAVNQNIAQDSATLSGAEEVAFLPPFTGG
jgi:molybdopterin synthase sulfur carrier subunit